MTDQPASLDKAVMHIPNDVAQMTRAVTSMATMIENTVAQFPRDAEGNIPSELFRFSSRVALADAGNKLEYLVAALDRELAWAKAKVLAWCAAEAQWKAENA